MNEKGRKGKRKNMREREREPAQESRVNNTKKQILPLKEQLYYKQGCIIAQESKN